MVKANWRHILVWLLILVVASLITAGVEPFLPLILGAVGIAIYEVGRRWIARQRARRSAIRTQG